MNFVRFYVIWIAGSMGTAMTIHACGVHFHSKTPWMVVGDLLVWLAFALAFGLDGEIA